jgi:hypothetical protein
MPVTPVAYGKLCFRCIVFRTTNKIPGENRANMVPNGDSPLDFPSGEIEHPPPPPPPLPPLVAEEDVAALASLEYAEFPAVLNALNR